MYLLDTMVVSALRRPDRHAAVVRVAGGLSLLKHSISASSQWLRSCTALSARAGDNRHSPSNWSNGWKL